MPSQKSPLYIDIAEQLRADIGQDQFPSLRLPTERELVKRFGASVITIRKALDCLVKEGLLVRRRGAGTYIKKDGQGVSPPRLTRRSYLIAYLCGTGTELYAGNFFNRLMANAHDAMDRKGFAPVLCNVMRGNLPMPIERKKVDGVIVASDLCKRGTPAEEVSVQNNIFMDQLVKTGLPIVGLYNHTDCPAVHRLFPNYEQGFRDSIEYLKSLGHRKIGLCIGPVTGTTNKNRQAEFNKQMAQAGYSPEQSPSYVYPVSPFADPNGVVQFLRRELSQPNLPSALLVGSASPMLVIRAIKSAGLRIPDDISLLSLSHHPRPENWSQLHEDPDEQIPPDIAVLELPTIDLGIKAVDGVLDIIEGRPFLNGKRDEFLPMTLIKGSSVRSLL